jgi:cell fate (sporulation/competence/biofilm development) regulator YlbF (YheA/YmcA/DUF963 family)
MRKSEFVKEIKNQIYEILSEVDIDKTAGSVVMPKTSLPADIKKLTAQGIDVQLKEEEEDREPTKAELAKEKVKTVSKFKVSNSEFEDFKTKLKTLVKKIKAMESGDEKTKKMAALKQFIKKPELVKAFKERDVKIDTDGLVG